MRKIQNITYGKQNRDICWNCCHEFDNIITGSMKRHKEYTYGDFDH